MIPSESWKRLHPNYHAQCTTQSIAKSNEPIFIRFFWRNSLKKVEGADITFSNIQARKNTWPTNFPRINVISQNQMAPDNICLEFFSEAISKLCMSSTQFWSHSFLFLLENPLNTWWIWTPKSCCQNPHCTICQDSDWEFSMDRQTWIRKLICLVCLANIHFFFLSTGNMGYQVFKRGIQN